MAKYCIKCGKALPDGVEICSECNLNPSGGDDAALFTRMTSETEIWKESVDDARIREKSKKVKKNRKPLLIGAASAALAVLVLFVVLFSLPAARVTRAMNGGDYGRALEIYTEKLADKGEHPKSIDKALLEAAEMTNASFAAHDITLEKAEEVMNTLRSFGGFTESLLGEVFSSYEVNKLSQTNMEEAEKLFVNGEYLDAYACYKKVAESDAGYSLAQSQADECLHRYAQSVLQQAGEFIIQDDYVSAIEILQEGNDTLLDYDTFSEDIDAKLLDCFALHESFILTEANHMAELEDYDAAVNMIRSCIEKFGYETESLIGALGSYEVLADEKLLSDACSRAETLYGEGAYAEAFAELDGVGEAVKNKEAHEEALLELEQRFTEEMMTAAEAAFAGERDNLSSAIAILDTAIEIRPGEEMEEYRQELEALLPVSLVDMGYASKEGVIFRSDSTFEGLDGVSYSEGWIWGENKASLSFDLDGKYDLLEGVFTNRRKDSYKAYGCYEIWCDDTKVYSSQPLYHGVKEAMPLSLDVSGCKTLKIVFINNYQVSTAEDGYCYHGLCSPVLTKNMD